MKEQLSLPSVESAKALLGPLGAHQKQVERLFSVRLTERSEGLEIEGETGQVFLAKKLLSRLLHLQSTGVEIQPQLIQYLGEQLQRGRSDLVQQFQPDVVCTTAKGRPIAPKTAGQKQYLEAISKHELCFAFGPAGTGKTFLAVALAVAAFRNNQVDRIILTRPAVEAGEKLGFLPGDLQMKVDPYMRPLYDALHEFMGPEQYLKNQEKGLIEVSPLAYMRGRTLDHAFIILDEAQNTTPEQMKMFLTRIGFQSKVVVTGDLTQTDLPPGKRSGLLDAKEVLSGIEGIKMIELGSEDVVRNGLVQTIIRAYDKAGKARMQQQRSFGPMGRRATPGSPQRAAQRPLPPALHNKRKMKGRA